LVATGSVPEERDDRERGEAAPRDGKRGVGGADSGVALSVGALASSSMPLLLALSVIVV